MPEVVELLRTALGEERSPGDLFERTLRRAASRERRRRVTAGVVAGLVLAVAAVGLWSAFGSTGPAVGPSPTPGPTVRQSPSAGPTTGSPWPPPGFSFPTPLVPATTVRGDTVAMPITLPVGITAVLRFPRDLGLAELGAQPEAGYFLAYLSGHLDGPFPITFLHGRTTSGMVSGAAPLTTFHSEGNRVELWKAAADSAGSAQEGGAWLVFRLPSWTVLAFVPDHANRAETIDGARTVVRGLGARETPDGFVTLTATDVVAISSDPGEGLGAVLALGDADPRVSFVRTDDEFHLVLVHAVFDTCEPGDQGDVGEGADYASVCIGQNSRWALFVQIYGPPRFVRDVVANLRADPVCGWPGANRDTSCAASGTGRR